MVAARTSRLAALIGFPRHRLGVHVGDEFNAVEVVCGDVIVVVRLHLPVAAAEVVARGVLREN